MNKRIIVDFSWIARKMWYVRGKPQDIDSICSDIMMSVLKIIKDDDYESELILVFDGNNKDCGRRYREDEQYKATREYGEEYDALWAAQDKLFEVLPKLGIKCLKHDGVEADDLQYLISSHEDYEDLLFCNDRDWLISVAENPNTCCYRPAINKQPAQFVDRAELCREFGLENASQYLLYKAVYGDGSDNIPGVSYQKMSVYSIMGHYLHCIGKGLASETTGKIDRNIELMRLDRIITDAEVIKEVISQLRAVNYNEPNYIDDLLTLHRPYMAGVLETYNRLMRQR